MKQCQPNSKFGDISREVSHRWEMLCSHEKAKYKRRIDEAKKEYKQELEHYKKTFYENTSASMHQRGKFLSKLIVSIGMYFIFSYSECVLIVVLL